MYLSVQWPEKILKSKPSDLRFTNPLTLDICRFNYKMHHVSHYSGRMETLLPSSTSNVTILSISKQIFTIITRKFPFLKLHRAYKCSWYRLSQLIPYHPFKRGLYKCRWPTIISPSWYNNPHMKKCELQKLLQQSQNWQVDRWLYFEIGINTMCCKMQHLK